MQAALAAGVIVPAILAQLTFKSSTQYVWTGVGTLVWNGFTFQGVGSFGSLGTIVEGTEVKADGTSVGLSGIDPALYSDCLTDIQLGAAANIWFALLSDGVIIGSPYLLFSGQVDKPSFTIGGENISVNLALESRMTDLKRASNRRYTTNDQHVAYPDDTAFNGVEKLNDQALLWQPR